MHNWTEAHAISLRPCIPDRDGPLIRALSAHNFRGMMERAGGWDDERAKLEPRYPERYLMVVRHTRTIGFIGVRNEQDALYLQTMQLRPRYCGQGTGTLLLRIVEQIALTRGLNRVRLRVYKENRAHHLYRRTGYVVTSDDGASWMMEKHVGSATTS